MRVYIMADNVINSVIGDFLKINTLIPHSGGNNG